MTQPAALVLASASPRRRALLEAIGLSFSVQASAADESFDASSSAEEAAASVALAKARAVFQARASSASEWILAADTMVVLEGVGDGLTVLDKPADPVAARRTLERLSGTRHRVVTGLAALDAGGRPGTDAETTYVTMRVWTPAEIEDYVESGEWRGKAGGYAIQETADRFVVRLEGGGFDNVVGLPVERALRLLERVGWTRPELE